MCAGQEAEEKNTERWEERAFLIQHTDGTMLALLDTAARKQKKAEMTHGDFLAEMGIETLTPPAHWGAGSDHWGAIPKAAFSAAAFGRRAAHRHAESAHARVERARGAATTAKAVHGEALHAIRKMRVGTPAPTIAPPVPDLALSEKTKQRLIAATAAKARRAQVDFAAAAAASAAAEPHAAGEVVAIDALVAILGAEARAIADVAVLATRLLAAETPADKSVIETDLGAAHAAYFVAKAKADALRAVLAIPAPVLH